MKRDTGSKQDTSLKPDIGRLREALFDIVGILNRPQPDAALIALAGVDLERTLFPALVAIERRGPLAIGELAELGGRNYTTVSRQVAKLEELGLVTRESNEADARITQVTITKKGRTMTTALDGAREKLWLALLADWDKKDVAELARLLRKLADVGLEYVRTEKARTR